MKKIIFPKIDLSNVQGVLIDLDNTLYGFEAPHQKAMHKVCTFLKKYHPMDFDSFVSAYRQTWDSTFARMGNVPSSHHRHMLFQQMAEQWHIQRPFLVAQKAHDIYFETVFKNMKIDADALAFLKQCARCHVPICLVTDLFALIQIQKLKALKIEKYIDFIVSNDEVGHDKPHPDMFLRALGKLGLEPSQVIMIGDNIPKDIEGAQKLGIRAYTVQVLK